MKKFQAQIEDKGKRLDKYLDLMMPKTSRSQIKKMIKEGLVLVNDQEPSVHQFLKAADIISIKSSEQPIEHKDLKLKILHKGKGYIVIEKPAGVLSHRSNSNNNIPAVTDWFLRKYSKSAEVGEQDRPGIIHRLDKETSGVMIIATEQSAYEYFKRQFHDRLIQKEYIALVHGHFADMKSQINKPIGRSKTTGRMAARPSFTKDKDREAITDYEVINRFQNYDLVRAFPKTGRTHQIRVHFKSMGCPIVGDKIYRLRKQKKIIDSDRIFLHAKSITFIDPEGKEQIVKSPIPHEFKEFIKTQK